ncbi:hypothetical protein ASE36_13775 [Rhizobium sp. Root274]|nr:hypothetical protein ASE36_13775 [Rhizobium sp. Root274]
MQKKILSYNNQRTTPSLNLIRHHVPHPMIHHQLPPQRRTARLVHLTRSQKRQEIPIGSKAPLLER